MCVEGMFDSWADVVSCELIGARSVALWVRHPEIAATAQPGQFCMLFAGEDWGLLLGRPLGITEIDGDRVLFLLEMIGKGTRWMGGLREGEKIRVRGPIGTPLPEIMGRRLWLAAGTLGVAPLLLAAQRFPDKVESLLLGMPDTSWEPFAQWVKGRFPNVQFFYQSGETQDPNPVAYLKNNVAPDDEVWACGPDGMMAALDRLIAPQARRVMVSLETMMGCGYGGCLGCSVHLKERSVLVCSEGPFFDSKEVKWDER